MRRASAGVMLHALWSTRRSALLILCLGMAIFSNPVASNGSVPLNFESRYVCPLRLFNISHRAAPSFEPLLAPGYSPLVYRDALGFSSALGVLNVSSLATRHSSLELLLTNLRMLELLSPHDAKVAGQEGLPTFTAYTEDLGLATKS